MEEKRVGVRLWGSVQGVGLRYAIMHKALDLKLSGFVKNEENKNEVYFEAQGKKEDLEDLINWSRKNPAWANIDKFEVTELELAELPMFYIQY